MFLVCRCLCTSRSVIFVVFFFFKQKTAYEMRISDWSSDVCSSDLLPEKMVRKMRGLYSAGAPETEHVVVDPPFFSGQNFASADALAKRIVSHLAGARAGAEPASTAA